MSDPVEMLGCTILLIVAFICFVLGLLLGVLLGVLLLGVLV